MAVVISGSQLDRVFACPASEHVPFHVDVDSAAAADGRRDHEILATRLVRDELLGPGWRAEVKFVYDIASRTARELPPGSAREYGALGPYEIPCTVDGFNPDGAVVDWKTKFGYVAPVHANPQLLLGALCVALVYGLDKIEMIIGKTYGKDAAECEPHLTNVIVDRFELDDFAERLARLPMQVAAAKASPTYREGEHCTYCPGRKACPPRTYAIRAVGEIPMREFVTRETAGALYDKVKTIRSVLADYDAALRWLADSGPVPLPNGRQLVKRPVEGNEKISASVAADVLREIIGDEFAGVAMTKTTSKKGITEAIRAAGKPIAATERTVLAAIRKLGGATRSVREDYVVEAAEP